MSAMSEQQTLFSKKITEFLKVIDLIKRYAYAQT